MENDKKITEKVLKIKGIIETKEYKIKELQNFYNNINNSKEISEYEKEFLTEIVEKKIRVEFPSKAKKILGGKSERAKGLLEEVMVDLLKEFDWSNNDLKTKVKAVGSMISGKEYVCHYISYKNDQGYSTGLGYYQITPEDDAFLEVVYRRVGMDYEKDREVKKFPVQLKDEAVTLFKTHLSKTKNNNKKSNIQFQVGACFYFNKHTLIDDKDADQVMIKSYLSCKPLIDYLFK